MKIIKLIEFIHVQRKVEIIRYVTFDEDANFGKARDIPPPPPKEDNDEWDILDCPTRLQTNMVYNPITPMDLLDPPFFYSCKIVG